MSTLSIVVPFHNEKENIPLVLERFRALAQTNAFELICVDDASGDGSDAIFKNLLQDTRYHFARSVFIASQDHRGYGHAIMTGIAHATGDVIAWTHSDLQTDPGDVIRAFAAYQHYPNSVIKGYRIQRPFKDVIFSSGMAFIASCILHRWFYEINAQPKLFSRNFLHFLQGAPDDFSLDLYLLYQAKKHMVPIRSIDVYFPERIHGQSSWAHSFRSKWKTILRTIKYIVALRNRT